MDDATFDDPVFLQSLGRVTISFALLEGTLNAFTDFFPDTPALQAIARMEYNKKVECFTSAAKSEFARLGIKGQFDAAFFQQLKCDLTRVAAERNRLMHDFWTFATDPLRMVLISLKHKDGRRSYPTTDKLNKLSDQIYGVRERVGPLVREYLAKRKLEGQKPAAPTAQAKP